MNRDETISYAQERSLPIRTTKDSPYSIDENLWGRSIECGVLEDPWTAPPDDIYEMTAGSNEGPTEIELSFEGGIPVSIDGEQLAPGNLIESLSKVAGDHGFGRVDMIEDRVVGIKSREIYEAPAALALIKAHQDLETITLERSVLREKRRLEAEWTELVYNGLWFSPLKEAIDAFAETTQRYVSGDVRLRFTAGNCTVTGRRAADALYEHSLATYDEGDSFRHEDAAGFVRLWGLATKRWASVHKRG